MNQPATEIPERTAVTVRRADVHDAVTVHTMLVELAEHENTASAVHSTVADWRRMLANPTVVVLVAFAGAEPVGYVSGVRTLNLWVGGDSFTLDDLYVRAGARDHGVGGRLMAALAAHVADDQLLITWGVREDNDAGHRFYRRLGASLRTKVVAAWRPADYTQYLATRSY